MLPLFFWNNFLFSLALLELVFLNNSFIKLKLFINKNLLNHEYTFSDRLVYFYSKYLTKLINYILKIYLKNKI